MIFVCRYFLWARRHYYYETSVASHTCTADCVSAGEQKLFLYTFTFFYEPTSRIIHKIYRSQRSFFVIINFLTTTQYIAPTGAVCIFYSFASTNMPLLGSFYAIIILALLICRSYGAIFYILKNFFYVQ